jgi:ferredoxin
MSTWLAKARERRTQLACARPEACANCANCAKTSQSAAAEESFGTNGPIGTASEVPADEIWSRFSWITQRLVDEYGRSPATAQRDGLFILKAQLLNDLRLAPTQVDPRRCFVCGEAGTPIRVLAPVLTARPDARLWLHLEPCHHEHQRRRSGEVDELLWRALSRPTISANVEEDPSREGEGQNSAFLSGRTGGHSRTRDAAEFEADLGATP